jgi:nucleotide-binding universal stress UspA family protein
VITLITVHDDQGLRSAKRYVGKAKVGDYLREISEKELRLSLSVLVKAGIKHNTIIQTGHVAETIAKAANKGFDLVVMGAKGRGGILDLLIGSVAQRVLSTCKKPVLLIK